MIADLREQLATRFWALVGPVNGDQCRNWLGRISGKHGRFQLRVNEWDVFKRPEVSAHIVAWWLVHGVRERFIDRKCHNTLCCNLDHLEVRTPESRFWQKVDKSTLEWDDCWVWLGACSALGYGSCVGGAAHRVSYVFANGPIPKGLVVRHRCNNPRCVRPSHLLLGTQHDNVHDAIRAGRMDYVRGARVGKAKLTNVQAIALRELYPIVLAQSGRKHDTRAVFARLLNVSGAVVRRIVKGLSYTDAAEQESKKRSRK
jgi:hypothetical protein